MFHLSYHHADKINRLPYRIPLATKNVLGFSGRRGLDGVWTKGRALSGIPKDINENYTQVKHTIIL